MPIAPTLILGLGGTGSKIVERVRDMVAESDSTQSERIAFVVFDTDINDLGRIRRQSPDVYTVQTSTRNTVGEYLSINTNARDNWFPVNEMMNRKTLTEGAAQVRAISRLAFDTTLKGGNLSPLHDAIEQLFRIDKDQEEQSLRVIIASSLAGGTGSGLLLSVSMYLANYLKTRFPKAKAITRGFFVQPDVFYKVIPATEEQRNLQVNAYAAVRELDAFLMKGDNTLPEKYRHLSFEFPRVGGEGVEEVHAMPYDFCFLFDANNKEGGSLSSFASYLDHAATCIYTQSIGPMSKKSNSREDNVLREVIKNDGRNRYAGAGASRLIYPWQHIRDVVGFQWADQALSAQWLQFDQQFKDRQAALVKRREAGFSARDLDRGAEFISSVDIAADNKEPFARAVMQQCLAFDEDGLDVVGNQWSTYVAALGEHIRRSGTNESDDASRQELVGRISDLAESTDGDEYTSVFYDLERHQTKVERNAGEVAGILGFSIFKSDSVAVTKGKHPHILETYLRDRVSGSFVHPVSARYFLYQTTKTLRAERVRTESDLERSREYFKGFARSNFDDASTDDIVETPEMYANRKKRLGERIMGKPGSEKQDLAANFSTYLNTVDEFRDQLVYATVLTNAIEYVDGLTASFETFFVSLEGNLKRLRSKVDQERTKFDDLTGSTTRYVLATSDCVDSIAATMPYMGGATSVDSALSESIYNRVREYAMLKDEKNEGYFKDLYTQTILGYFSDQVMKNYSEQIKIDIIEALEREYRIVERDFEQANVEHYVRSEIEKAKRLASPFIEQPLGEERHPIEACAYNPIIEGDADPKRKTLVSELLGNYGGERDDEISPHEILFYNAIYGIRASDLSKFAPERQSATEHRPAGDYFTSYYDLVSGIKPSVGETKVITPHVDRRWHSLSELPDLDDENQARDIARIHSALLLGIVYDRLEWCEAVRGANKVYRYRPVSGLAEEFVVSNGTPCDQFYEVLDSLTINPVAVREILTGIDQKKQRARERMRVETFGQTEFAEVLREGIRLEQLAKDFPSFAGAKLSVFDVVGFYALSIPADLYTDQQVYAMANDFIAQLDAEIAAVTDDDEAAAAMLDVIDHQLSLFQTNIDRYRTAAGSSFVRKLRTIMMPIIEFAEREQLNDLYKKATALDRALRDA